MGGRITSDTIAASSAISELVGVDTSQAQNQQVEFSDTSDIPGMEAARQTCNQMLTAIGDFSQAVLTQADKFPQLAAKIEKRDVDEASRWSDV